MLEVFCRFVFELSRQLQQSLTAGIDRMVHGAFYSIFTNEALGMCTGHRLLQDK